MTTWSIFPATNGPAAATAFSGSYVAGMMWKVNTSGLWLYGYRWWCCNTGQDTSSKKCALWNPKSSTGGDGALIPNSVAFTGTLTPGAWNTALLPAPLPVSLGTPYLACVAQNGAFPFTTGQFGPAEPFASGITQGPVVAYSDSSLGATVNATPYVLPQGCFTTAVADPTLAMPATGNNSFNSWVDVIISDQPPAGFSGPYELFPNKFDTSPATALDTNLPFNLAVEIDVAQRCRAGNLKFWSITGAASLPTAAGIWDIGSQQLISSNMAPAWLDALTGGAAVAGGGKVETVMPATVLLPGKYRVSVFNAAGAGGAWSPREFGYFLTGAGAAGVSWGPVTAPAQGSAQNAYVFQPNGASTPPWTSPPGPVQQPQNGTFAHDSFIFPYLGVVDGQSSGAPPGAVAENFWVDLELAPLASGGSAVPDLHDRPFRRKLWL